MSNIVSLNAHRRTVQPTDKLERHVSCFSQHRRAQEDVFWLKENAELLNILQATETKVTASALGAYGETYERLPELISFFPQYYRFWLSICLDLEDLGMDDGLGEQLCDWAAKEGLAEAELSDLQRAEAERLLSRRVLQRPDEALRDRLIRFSSRAQTFAIPNKKAAYELTHIVFYLSEYGSRDPQLPQEMDLALEYAGTLAALEQNFDLLAEICVARRYAGFADIPQWSAAVCHALDEVSCGSAPSGPQKDDYHWYFVSNWHAAQCDKPVFTAEPGGGGAWFCAPQTGMNLLGLLSAELQAPTLRGAEDWGQMRHYLEGRLPQGAAEHLEDVAGHGPNFDSFFAHFARRSAPQSSVLTRAI